MIIKSGNIVFDTENPLCKAKLAIAQGQLIGFFTFIDWYWGERKHTPTKKDTIQYFGILEEDEDGVVVQAGCRKVTLESVKNVMDYGAKFTKFEN